MGSEKEYLFTPICILTPYTIDALADYAGAEEKKRERKTIDFGVHRVKLFIFFLAPPFSRKKRFRRSVTAELSNEAAVKYHITKRAGIPRKLLFPNT